MYDQCFFSSVINKILTFKARAISGEGEGPGSQGQGQIQEEQEEEAVALSYTRGLTWEHIKETVGASLLRSLSFLLEGFSCTNVLQRPHLNEKKIQNFSYYSLSLQIRTRWVRKSGLFKF